MPIDRARFLFLTASMAAGACNTAQPPAAPVATVDIPPVSPAAPTVAQTPLAAPDAAQAEEPETTHPSPLDIGAIAPPFREGMGRPADPGPPSACDAANAQGSPGDCSRLRAPPGPACESFHDTRQECDDVKQTLAPAVAAKVVDCLVAKSGKRDICQFAVVAQCASAAFRTSCTDPATGARCRAIVRGCSAFPQAASAVPKVTAAECEGAIAAVPASQRSRMLLCMQEGCTAGYCFAYLK
jgi:hypothetical protein